MGVHFHFVITMDLVQLKRFLIAAEAGTLRQAALRLHLSQPALTQSIKALERALGEAVFVRGTQGVVLTPFGEALRPRAQLILNERTRIGQDLERLRSGQASQLSVGVGPYFTRHLLPVAVARTLERIPTLQIHLVEGHTRELVKQVQDGSLDLAFCVHNPLIAEDPDLRFEETYAECYSVMARASHPLFRRRRATEKDLAACSWIVYDSHATAGFLTDFFTRRGLAAPAWSISTLSLSAMIGALNSTDLLALVPRDYALPELAARRLKRVTGHALEVTGRGGLLTRRHAPESAAAHQLITQIRAACAAAAPPVPARRRRAAPRH
jgi:LysR family transcriptional regulator of abg operon